MYLEEKKWTVYIHKNKINGKRYVGITSKQAEDRWKNNGNGYKSQVFYRAIEKYGWDNFEHIIIGSQYLEDDAKELEIKLISEHKTSEPKYGYNILLGGNGSLGYIWNENNYKAIAVSVICLNTMEVFKSAKEAGRKHGLDGANLSACVRGEQLSFGEDENGNRLFWSKYIEGENYNGLLEEKIKRKSQPINAKPVVCLNTKEHFQSAIEGGKAKGCNGGKVACCCAGTRNFVLNESNEKFVWSYLENYLKMTEDEINEKISFTQIKKGLKRKIIYLPTKEIFNNLVEASKFANVSRATISNYIIGANKKKNYDWKYYDDYIEAN